jgi:hypothetical protein
MSRSDRLLSRLSLKRNDTPDTPLEPKSNGWLSTTPQSPDSDGSSQALQRSPYFPIPSHPTKEKFGLFEFPAVGPVAQSLLEDDVLHVE